jgi:hypothetical protein
MRDPSFDVAALEARLAAGPAEPETYLRLAYLHQSLSGDEARAGACYLQHLVRSLGFHDAEDAERHLAALARRGDAGPMVHVRLGLLHGYQGRRKQAAGEMKRGAVWLGFDSGHFRVHVIPGSSAHDGAGEFLREREDGLRRIADLFELAIEPDLCIRYFLYESLLHKEIVTGDPMPAHVFPDRAEVHAVHGPGFALDNPHEDAHVVLRRLGRAPKLLDEGAAEYVHRGPAVHPLCRRIADRAPQVRVEDLADDTEFLSRDPFVTYFVAASFVGFLVERHGAPAFKEYFAVARRQPDAGAKRIYSKSLAQLGIEWSAFLATRPDDGWEEA